MLFLLNHSSTPQAVKLRFAGKRTDLMTGRTETASAFTIGARDVRVLAVEQSQ
jgi:hypothetical protein